LESDLVWPTSIYNQTNILSFSGLKATNISRCHRGQVIREDVARGLNVFLRQSTSHGGIDSAECIEWHRDGELVSSGVFGHKKRSAVLGLPSGAKQLKRLGGHVVSQWMA
jgi:hypothetical protein